MNESTPMPGRVTQWRALDPAPKALSRLIVLLPNAELHEAQLARQLWLLAAHSGAHVHLVAMLDDWADDARVTLRLALLTALLRESGLEPTSQLEKDDVDWVRIVRRLYQPGDAIVCHAEQRLPAPDRGFAIARTTLGAYLSALRMPVFEVQGVISSAPAMTIRRAMRVWLLPILIVLISAVAQVLFLNWAQAWAAWAKHSALLAYTVLEILVIARLSRY